MRKSRRRKDGGYGFRRPVAESHRRTIELVLQRLSKVRRIEKFRFLKERSGSNTLYYRLVLVPNHRSLLLKITIPITDSLPHEKSSSGFSEICLPRIESEVTPDSVERLLRKEITRRMKGYDNEDVVLRILNEFVQGGVLRSAERAKDFDDKTKGMDHFVTMFDNDGRFIKSGLQVKTSLGEQALHKAKFPNVPSICVNPPETLSIRLLLVIEGLKRGAILHS